MPTPLPVINNTYRTALKWKTAGGQTAVNVLHFRSNVLSNAASVMENLDDNVTAAMWSMVSGAYQVTEVDITRLDGTTATASFVPGTPAHWIGGTGGDWAPQVAGVIKFQTALRGRANRGRIFLPPPGESQTTAGAFNDGTPATAQAAWLAFQAAIIADADTPMTQVVASYDRKHAGVGAHATDIIGYVGEVETATQRRRQGRNRT